MKNLFQSDRAKTVVAVVGCFLLVLAVGTLGFLLIMPGAKGPDDGTLYLAPAPTTPATTPDVPTTTPPPPATPPPPTKATTKKVIPKPTSTQKAAAKDIPPVISHDPPKAGCTPTHTGTDAPKADVKNALLAAGHRHYWSGVQLDPHLTVPLPVITVPDNLMKAFAWQESGWQSTILACDTGIGTMQLMPDTVEQVNIRFGTSFDVNTLAGNTQLGAQYIEWLIMYFGIYNFDQHFDLAISAPLGPHGEQVTLLQAVTAAYNVGPGTISKAGSPEIDLDAAKGVPRAYSNNVIALMSNCPCSQY
jgi:hypothetical protein